MGLFTNNKRPCPICGKGTPRLLATEIAGDVHLCSDCSGKISMEVSRIDDMSLDDLKAHLAFREENARKLREVFCPNKVYEIGWTHLNVDEANRLFTIPLNMCGDTKNPPIFQFDELTGYDLEEENCVIERFQEGDITPQCTPRLYIPQIRIHDDDKQPDLTTRSFKLNLYLKNPCWCKVESDAGAASGNDFNFQRDYNQHLNKLRFVTTALVNIMGQGIRQDAGRGSAGQGNADTVANELMKFKELMDSGIITSEEFGAKKKQLLGL